MIQNPPSSGFCVNESCSALQIILLHIFRYHTMCAVRQSDPIRSMLRKDSFGKDHVVEADKY